MKKSKENKTGRNAHFELSRAELVKLIEKDNFPNMHIRVINGVKTPCTNPNKSKNDNLG